MEFTVWSQSCLVCCYDIGHIGAWHEMTNATLLADGNVTSTQLYE